MPQLNQIAVSALLAALFWTAAGDDLEHRPQGPLGPDQPVAWAPVDYLDIRPVIDGSLDSFLRSLPERRFHVEEKSSPANPSHSASYRIAYGAEFFYLYLESEGDAFVYRDRSFQHGDGFNLLLALVEGAERRSDEFYVLAGGAVERPELDWARSVFWVHNVDTLFKKTSAETLVKFRAHDGRLSFEVYLPWKEVYPYHPWISAGLGFNLRLNRAVGDERERNQLTVLDDSIAAAGEDKAFVPLSFEAPGVATLRSYAILERNNVKLGDRIGLTVASAAPKETELSFDVATRSPNGALLRSSSLRTAVPAGTGRQTIFVPGSESLPAGGYEIHWTSAPSDQTSQVARVRVLPSFDREALVGRLEAARGSLQPASYETAHFLADELEGSISAVRSYDTGDRQAAAIDELNQVLAGIEGGRDVIAEARGFSRKAFRSRVDGTLQPYGVIVPETYDPSTKYPLVVYLHGSDSTEMDLSRVRFLVPDCCIGVGPFARGRTNFYLGEGPQTDIQEAIDAVASSYSVDRRRVVLTGFSMGGWGSFLTYYSSPERYLGLAAFSGIPYIPGNQNPAVPDFRKDELLGPFDGARAFVSHGRLDNVGTIDVIDTFVEKLRLQGAEVVYVVDDQRGHSRPSQPEIERYREWLLELVSGSP